MISGWGLNEQGKKFSKRDLEAKKEGQYSKYDPEDVIDKHGADALRYWAAGSHLGHDLRYHEEDVKAGRKLVLKLWNVTKLAEQYGEGYDLGSAAPVADRTPEDRWIVNRLEQVLPTVQRGFETYDYATAREALDRFFWDDFCDDYLEIVKDRFWSEDRYTDAQRDSARATMWETLRAVLGLYAPFVPFITEELYQYRFRDHEDAPSIHVTAYPEAPATPTAEVPEIETLLEVLRAVRSERTRLRIPQGRPLTEMVVDTSGAAPELRTAIEGLTDSIAAAARARVVRFDSAEAESTIPGIKIDITPEEKREAS
jgi:valyl-tRNA synthetase